MLCEPCKTAPSAACAKVNDRLYTGNWYIYLRINASDPSRKAGQNEEVEK
jgi:hypothetical protein